MRYSCTTPLQLYEILCERDVAIWGVGDFFRRYIERPLRNRDLKGAWQFFDGKKGIVRFLENEYDVYPPEEIKKITNKILVITSLDYILEIHNRLKQMNVDDSVTCLFLPLVMTRIEEDTEQAENYFSHDKRIIPKIIHSFWFSGETKPMEYQRCIDSWKKICPDYEIIEWGMDNYDYTKNLFMHEAIKHKKWAFAADYARLDVIYKMGGIYMDMDVELVKPIDDFCGAKSFFTFDTGCDVDLAMFGSVRDNPLIKDLLFLYDGIHFSPDTMMKYVQPDFIRETLSRQGVCFDGRTQAHRGNVFLNRRYLSPMDYFMYRIDDKARPYFRAIHYFNTGWIKDDFKNTRRRNTENVYDAVFGKRK